MDSPQDMLDDAISQADRRYAARVLDDVAPMLSRGELEYYRKQVRAMPSNASEESLL